MERWRDREVERIEGWRGGEGGEMERWRVIIPCVRNPLELSETSPSHLASHHWITEQRISMNDCVFKWYK